MPGHAPYPDRVVAHEWQRQCRACGFWRPRTGFPRYVTSSGTKRRRRVCQDCRGDAANAGSVLIRFSRALALGTVVTLADLEASKAREAQEARPKGEQQIFPATRERRRRLRGGRTSLGCHKRLRPPRGGPKSGSRRPKSTKSHCPPLDGRDDGNLADSGAVSQTDLHAGKPARTVKHGAENEGRAVSGRNGAPARCSHFERPSPSNNHSSGVNLPKLMVKLKAAEARGWAEGLRASAARRGREVRD